MPLTPNKPLNPKQKAFADYWIEGGNGTEAARKAGYKGNDGTLAAIAAENLKKPNIAAYIKARMDAQDAARVADADEVLRFYTAVMRGEEKDQFGLDASLSDRLNAGKELMKRYAAAENSKRGEFAKSDDPLTAALKEEMKNGTI